MQAYKTLKENRRLNDFLISKMKIYTGKDIDLSLAEPSRQDLSKIENLLGMRGNTLAEGIRIMIRSMELNNTMERIKTGVRIIPTTEDYDRIVEEDFETLIKVIRRFNALMHFAKPGNFKVIPTLDEISYELTNLEMEIIMLYVGAEEFYEYSKTT